MPTTPQEIRDATAAAYGIVSRCTQALRRLAESAGYAVPCRRGCRMCCHFFIMVTFAEAVPIALWLASPKGGHRLEHFRERMKRIRDALGPEAAVLEDFLARAVSLSPPGPDSSRYDEVAAAYRHLVCPFNADDGSCQIYRLRPLQCRVHYVVGASEHCGLDAQRGPAVLRHPTLTQATELASGILRGVSTEAGCLGSRLLPGAVEIALAWLRRCRPEAGYALKPAPRTGRLRASWGRPGRL